jgi:hypothetical protein
MTCPERSRRKSTAEISPAAMILSDKISPFSQVETMKMDYIVSRIEASQDGSPYVYVTYANSNEFKASADRGAQFNPFGPNMMAFTSPEDFMKNLPKARPWVEVGDFQPILPPLKSASIFEDMSIKVGDKVTIEIKKAESSGI